MAITYGVTAASSVLYRLLLVLALGRIGPLLRGVLSRRILSRRVLSLRGIVAGLRLLAVSHLLRSLIAIVAGRRGAVGSRTVRSLWLLRAAAAIGRRLFGLSRHV
jgi:hypothetical protein